MKMPHADNALVPDAKITAYLLNPNHPKGKEKAAVFTRFGFSVAKWEEMGDALRHHASEHEVTSSHRTAHCEIYILEGALSTPDGRDLQVRSVWCVRHGETIPRLVTAYPL